MATARMVNPRSLPARVDDRLKQIRNFLSETDDRTDPDFLRKLDRIELDIDIWAARDCDETLLRDVKIKLEVHRLRAYRLRDGSLSNKTPAGTYQKLSSTRLSSTSRLQTAPHDRSSEMSSGRSRNTATEHHEALQEVPRTKSSVVLDSTDTDSDLNRMKASVYLRAIQNPENTSRWLHPTLNVADQKPPVSDKKSVYVHSRKSRLPPRQYSQPAFLKQREQQINETLISMNKVGPEFITGKDYIRLQELLQPFLPESLRALYEPFTSAKTMSNGDEQMIDAQYKSRTNLSSQFDATFKAWVTNFRGNGVRIRVSQPRVPKIDMPGVFYVEDDLQARVEQVQRWEDQLNLIFSKIERRKPLDQAAARRLLEISKVVMRDLYNEYERRRERYLDGREEEDLYEAQRKKLDEILIDVTRKHVDLACGKTLKALWKGEPTPHSSEPSVIYVPWDDRRRPGLDRAFPLTPAMPSPIAQSDGPPETMPNSQLLELLRPQLKEQEARIKWLLKQKHLDSKTCTELNFGLLRFWGPLLQEVQDKELKLRIQADIDPDYEDIQSIFNAYRKLGKNILPFKYICQRLGFQQSGLSYGYCGSGQATGNASPFWELALYVPPDPMNEAAEDALRLQTSINAMSLDHTKHAKRFPGAEEYETSKLFALFGRFLPDELVQKGLEWQHFQQIIPAILGRKSPSTEVVRLERLLFKTFSQALTHWLRQIPSTGVEIRLKRAGDENDPYVGKFYVGGDQGSTHLRQRSPPYVQVWQDGINALLRQRRKCESDWWIETQLQELLQDFMPPKMVALSRSITAADHWRVQVDSDWIERPAYFECWSAFYRLYLPWLATFQNHDIRIRFPRNKSEANSRTPGILYLNDTWRTNKTEFWGPVQPNNPLMEVQDALNQYIRHGITGEHDQASLENQLKAIWDQEAGLGIRRKFLEDLGMVDHDISDEARLASSLHAVSLYRYWLRNLLKRGLELIQAPDGTVRSAHTFESCVDTTKILEADTTSEAQVLIPEGVTTALHEVWELFQKVESMRLRNVSLGKEDRERARRLIAILDDAELDLLIQRLCILIEDFQQEPQHFSQENQQRIQTLQEQMWWQLLGNEYPDYRKLLIPETPPLGPFTKKQLKQMRRLPMVVSQDEDYSLLGTPCSVIARPWGPIEERPPTPLRRERFGSLTLRVISPSTSQLTETESNLNILLKKYKDGTLSDREYGIFDDLLTYLVPAGSDIEAVYRKIAAVKRRISKEDREPKLIETLLLIELQEEFEASYTIWRESLPNLAIRLDTLWYDEIVLKAVVDKYEHYQADLEEENRAHSNRLLEPKVLHAWAYIDRSIRRHFNEAHNNKADNKVLLLSSLPAELHDAYKSIVSINPVEEQIENSWTKTQEDLEAQLQRDYTTQVKRFIENYMSWCMDLPLYFAARGPRSFSRVKAKQPSEEPFEELQRSNPLTPSKARVPLALPLDPAKRPVEHDPFKYTKIMQDYNHRMDQAYAKARQEVIAANPHSVRPPNNRNGPFTVPTAKEKRNIERARLEILTGLSSGLNESELSQRPLLSRMKRLLTEALRRSGPGNKPYHKTPLSPLELQGLEMMCERSRNSVWTAYPPAQYTGVNKLDQHGIELFEKHIEALPPASVPVWKPELPHYADSEDELMRSLMPEIYESQVESVQGLEVTELLELLNGKDDIEQKWDQRLALKYLPVLHKFGRIHFDKLVSLIPLTGHPENRDAQDDGLVERSTAAREVLDNTIIVQTPADRQGASPNRQICKYQFLLTAASKLGAEICWLGEKHNSRRRIDLNAETLHTEVMKRIKDVRVRMRVDDPDHLLLDIATGVLRDFPDLDTATNARTLDLVNEKMPLDKRLKIARQIIQNQTSIELSNNWDPQFSSNEQTSGLWAWAAEPRQLQYPRPERYFTLDGRSGNMQRSTEPESTGESARKSGSPHRKPAGQDSEPEPTLDTDSDSYDGMEYDGDEPFSSAQTSMSKKERYISQNGARPFMPFPETPFHAAYASHQISNNMTKITKGTKETTPSRLASLVSRIFSPFRSVPASLSNSTAPIFDARNSDASFIFQADTHGYLPASHSLPNENEAESRDQTKELHVLPQTEMPSLPELPEGWIPRTVSRKYMQQAIDVVRREWGLDPPLTIPPRISGTEHTQLRPISAKHAHKAVRFSGSDPRTVAAAGGREGSLDEVAKLASQESNSAEAEGGMEIDTLQHEHAAILRTGKTTDGKRKLSRSIEEEVSKDEAMSQCNQQARRSPRKRRRRDAD